MTEFADILQQALAPAYTLERELTGGGMSRVFVATDVALARKVVVKVLPPELAAGVNHERFRREIQVAAQLQHPHVVPLLSAGEQGTLIWYTMPYINGSSLRETLARGDTYAIKDVVRIMRDVAEALDYAHGLGVIHRDIKPGNVLLMGSHALVTDFGVAKAISASMPSSGFTSAGMAIGTPAYMAPEQIAADPAADHRMDLYALGLLAYEMLTGHVPFKEDSPQKTMAAQLTREPAPLEQSRTDVPPALSMLIRKLLAKLPEERPQVASEVVNALDDIALTSGQHLAPVRPTRKPSLGRTLLIAAAGVGVIGTAWLAGQRVGTETVVSAYRDSLATADSMEVVASAAAMLTREDSMAIAKAVSDRMSVRTKPAKTPGATEPAATVSAAELALERAVARADSAALVVMADSIRQVIQRAVLDSLVQLGARVGAAGVRIGEAVRGMQTVAQVPAVSSSFEGDGPRAAPTPGMRSAGPRRVVVAPPRPSRTRPDVDKVAAVLVDSLRNRIDGSPRYVVVAADTVAAALRESRTLNTLHERLDADFIVSISLVPMKDSVIRLITVHDMGAPQGMDRRVIVSSVVATDPFAGMADLMPQVLPLMQDMERMRFRQPPPGGANGPRGPNAREMQVRTMTAPAAAPTPAKPPVPPPGDS